jgi:hypothetical protein
MTNPTTYSGATVAICTTAQNSDLGDLSPGFAGLTYVNIANVGTIGEYGNTTTMVSYNVMDRVRNLKAKGNTDGGDFTIECAVKNGDAGQLAIIAAADPDAGAQYQDNYAFEITLPNGDVHYLRGPVGGPTYPGGGNEDFVRMSFMVGVNEIKIVPDTP